MIVVAVLFDLLDLVEVVNQFALHIDDRNRVPQCHIPVPDDHAQIQSDETQADDGRGPEQYQKQNVASLRHMILSTALKDQNQGARHLEHSAESGDRVDPWGTISENVLECQPGGFEERV